MAEAAGFVLGAIPLVIWALEKYAEPLEMYSHYHNHIKSFRSDLRLQERQLQLTLSIIGLQNPTMDELCQCIRSKCPAIADEVLHIIQNMDRVTEKLMQKLGVDFKQKMSAMPHASWWEWRRIKNSISAKRREAVIDQLRKYNADLQRCLQAEQSEVQAEDDNPVVLDLNKRFNMDRCNALRLCLGSLHRALAASRRCACLTSHQTALDLDWCLYESAAQPGFNIAVSYQQGLPLWCKLHATPKYTTTPMASSRTTPNEVSLATPTPVTSPVISSFCDIVASNTGEHVLQDNDEDHGRNFVFRHNSDEAKIVRLIPFKSLHLQHNHQNLSLKARCGLAAYTTWSILHLSSSPWIGDDWDGGQVGIFLEKRENDGEKFAERPCFLYDFATPPQTTTGTDTPEEQSKGPFSNMIVVFFGILLVELCLGKSFTQATPSATFMSRRDSAQKSMDEVYSLAGRSYGDAAKGCIRFCFSGQDSHNTFEMERFRATFYRDVVAPVQATYVHFLD